MTTNSLAGLSILLVDDDHDNREVLGMALRRLGAVVSMAVTAGEARTRLEQGGIEVMVCDLSLGDTESGMALVASLPQIKARSIYAVAITGWADYDARKRALAAGFQEFFHKPVKIDQLTKLLTSIRAEKKT
jgi:CheY-like chemotaxis protein